MKPLIKRTLTAAIMAIVSAANMATAAAISGSADFEGGVFGDWTINYGAGPSGLLLQQATITLGSGNFFDTTGSAPGFLLSQDLSISPAEIAETQYVSVSP